MHLGEKIKQRAREIRLGPTQLGEQINTSKQNIYGIFKRQSLDTELLLRLSQALDYDFFALYSRKPAKESKAEKLKEEISQLKAEVAYLRKINDLQARLLKGEGKELRVAEYSTR
ncbi:MAG: hypothetical protein H6581_04810 [Bacteroidia bacterium]|nr:hypothetical protein [Bacteroidia bacterium]